MRLLLSLLNKFSSKILLRCWICLIDSLVIFHLVCSVLTFDSYNYFDLLFLGQFFNWFNQSNNSDMYTSDVWTMIILVLYSITLSVNAVPLLFLFWLFFWRTRQLITANVIFLWPIFIEISIWNGLLRILVILKVLDVKVCQILDIAVHSGCTY